MYLGAFFRKASPCRESVRRGAGKFSPGKELLNITIKIFAHAEEDLVSMRLYCFMLSKPPMKGDSQDSDIDQNLPSRGGLAFAP